MRSSGGASMGLARSTGGWLVRALTIEFDGRGFEFNQ